MIDNDYNFLAHSERMFPCPDSNFSVLVSFFAVNLDA